MPVKLLTSGGGGVNLVPSSSIASDQTMYLPTSGTSGGTVLCTDSSGNLGLGVTPSNAKSNVKTLEIGQSGSLHAWSSANELQLGSNFYYTSGSVLTYKTNGYASMYDQSSGIHSWFTAPSGTAGNAITFTQAMTLDASGRLGVGQTSPSAVIHTTSSNLGDGGGLKIQNTGSGGATFAIWPTATVNGEGAGKLIISGPSGNAACIDSSGNLLVGTTSGSYKITCNGQPGANGYTAWTNYSDARLKENVVDFGESNTVEKINKLRPVTFNYNDLSGYDESTRTRRISGFIAQELKEIFPDMVGSFMLNDTEYYDTNTSDLALYLVKAIQELSAQNKELTQRIEALEYTKQGE